MNWIYRIVLGLITVAVLALAPSVFAKQGYGTLSGIVLDPAGTPQMGATVWLISEDASGKVISQLLSNQNGAFSTDHLKPGRYSVRVSLTGYLPAIERHIAVMADLTTLLRVQIDSVFASLDTLRRKTTVATETDDWKWVLRSSAATRPVLQWRDDDSTISLNMPGVDIPRSQQPRGMVQLTNGTSRAASPSSLPNAPATTVSYDQQLGAMGSALLAGQMSYQQGASGAFAGVWRPSGTADGGPETVFVMHQTKVGPTGLTFQGIRFDHTERFNLGNRIAIHAGTEYLRVGMMSSVSAIRPHGQLDAALSSTWMASMIVASNPHGPQGQTNGLQTALDALDSLPAVLISNGDPVLEGGWHEEISIKHKLSDRSSLEAAGFHDAVRHQTVFGSGPSAYPDFFEDNFSNGILYDGGRTSSWGTRVAYHKKVSDTMDFAAIYAWAGALFASNEASSASSDLRDIFSTRNHQSLAGRVSGKLPRTGTQLEASYKWISGTALSRLDPFGEAAYQVDPYLHVSVRQPLPGMNGRWEALADFDNLLAQGYVNVTGQGSRAQLMPVLRSFRGGVSFQF